jgi:hypothetical protein
LADLLWFLNSCLFYWALGTPSPAHNNPIPNRSLLRNVSRVHGYDIAGRDEG